MQLLKLLALAASLVFCQLNGDKKQDQQPQQSQTPSGPQVSSNKVQPINDIYYGTQQKDILSLLKGRPTITGLPTYQNGIKCSNTSGNCLTFPDATTQNTAAGLGAAFWNTSGNNIFNNNAGAVNLIGPTQNANISSLKTTSTTWTWSQQNYSSWGSNPALCLENNNHAGLPFCLFDVPGGQRLNLWQTNIAIATLSVSGIYPTMSIGGDIAIGDIASIGTSPMSLFYRVSRGVPITSCTNLYSSYDTHFNAATDAGATFQICPQDNAAPSGSNDGYISLNANGVDTGSVANGIRFQNNNGSGVAQQIAFINSNGYVGSIGGVSTKGAVATIVNNSASIDYSAGARFTGTGTAAYAALQFVSSNGTTPRVIGTIDGTNQRLGILQGTPSYTLDVGGDINTTGSFRISGTAQQAVNSGATPTFTGTNFTGVPYKALTGITVSTTIFLSGSGTYTTKANITYLKIIAVGGGGGGGGCTSAVGTSCGAAGGGGGGYSLWIATNPAASYSYGVSSGAVGGANTGAAGSTANSTTFGPVTASGGVGGGGATASAVLSLVAFGGVGGTASGGTVNVQGAPGIGGLNLSASQSDEGAGGNSGNGFGAGGAANYASANGTNGTVYGGGGGGAGNVSNGGAGTGGNGAAGIVFIEEHYD